MAFPLTQEQRNIVDDRGGELLVSAAAGSSGMGATGSSCLPQAVSKTIARRAMSNFFMVPLLILL